MISFRKFIRTYIINNGVTSQDSSTRARAVSLTNVTTLNAFFNTMLFFGALWYMGHYQLALICLTTCFLFVSGFLFIGLGSVTFGRIYIFVLENIAVFYFSCLTQGEALIQCYFYSICISPFMHFEWKESRYFWLSCVPIILLALGASTDWKLIDAGTLTTDLRIFKLIAMVSTLQQITLGFFYFLKLSVQFELESTSNFKNLEIQHRKQIQIQKMSSLGEMSAGISHEINNPLMIILGKTHTIKRDISRIPDLDPKIINRLNDIDLMVERITRIIKALRSFSRNSENDMKEPTEVHTLINSTLDLCRERFQVAGIKIHQEIDYSLSIKCRQAEISQVILNLMNNAFDAATGGENSFVALRVRKFNSHVEILITDNGQGIRPEFQDKIMQPFFTTKEIGKATGLGLSVSKGLVEGHQGTLTYLHVPGVTTFQILLPADHH